MGENINDRDLGNGVYHRTTQPTSPQFTRAENSKPAKRQKLSWSDDTLERLNSHEHNGKLPTDITPLNGTANHGYSHSCFIQIPVGTLHKETCSNHHNRHSYPQNFYLRRHSDFIELMKNRRLESLRQKAEIKQRAEMSSALIEQFRSRDKPFKSTIDYYSVVLTFVIGLGNVLRFSHLCHQHGGGKL